MDIDFDELMKRLLTQMQQESAMTAEEKKTQLETLTEKMITEGIINEEE
ncbi:hypothetical protein [Ruminococcus sp.]|nr:hypothetical protein [Ruminococcus sp.]MBQ8967005.1 hypothetical protein [Ruminococcus sp.]